MCESVRENKKLNIDWNKFRVEVKGKHLDNAKNAYIEFCEMLNEVDFELVGDYISSKDKVELVYRLNNDIRLNTISSNTFKQTLYKTIINFKNNLEKNKDKFIKFIGLTVKRELVARIKTFDGGVVEFNIANYNSFNRSRQDFYSKLKEVNGYTTDYYMGNESKINICIEGVKLNPMSPHDFKRQTYKAIISFKNKLKENNDNFIKFVELTNKGKLISKIKTFDDGKIDIDMSQYNAFSKSRLDTYNYCKEKGYKILSPYVGNQEKILIDFNCGHKYHWIKPEHLKNNIGCPICSSSKGEKIIREYLEDNSINFKQEHKFEDCKNKRSLPFDFYIPKCNLCIEFDGEQHFKANNYFGEKEFELTQKRDNIKNKYCKNNNINLLRIPYWEIDSIEDILDKEFKRLRELNNKTA